MQGIAGGDRLQWLLHAIRCGINTRRFLVVDWTDTNWRHQPWAYSVIVSHPQEEGCKEGYEEGDEAAWQAISRIAPIVLEEQQP